jgi:hypothetical protein
MTFSFADLTCVRSSIAITAEVLTAAIKAGTLLIIFVVLVCGVG